VASRHAFPTCRGRGRNHEGDLADWTTSILTDRGRGPRELSTGDSVPRPRSRAYRTAERRAATPRSTGSTGLARVSFVGLAGGRARSDADDRIGFVAGRATLRLPESGIAWWPIRFACPVFGARFPVWGVAHLGGPIAAESTAAGAIGGCRADALQPSDLGKDPSTTFLPPVRNERFKVVWRWLMRRAPQVGGGRPCVWWWRADRRCRGWICLVR
jgi:hypothetical protein